MISELVTTTLPDETQGQCRALHDNTNAIAISINNILEIGEKYTLSLYLKAYSNNGQCGINQNSELLPYSNEWTRVVIPFTAISTGLSIIFTTGVYVYKANLKKGLLQLYGIIQKRTKNYLCKRKELVNGATKTI